MYISHKHKFIFIAVPKTGSSSMHIAFDHHNHPEPEEHHMGIARVLKENPECKNYYKFGFVRNPWDRLLSGYCDFVQNRKTKYSGKVEYEKPLLSEYKNFEEFCLDFPNSKWANDVHLRPQHLFLEIDGKLAVDYVGKFEKLSEDFNHACKAVNFPYDYKKSLGRRDRRGKPHRSSLHDHYSKHYTEETKNVIGDFFKRDIELFGYKF